MVQNLSLVPRPPAPWIDTKTGAPLPEFYRFIVGLLDLAGGSSAVTLEDLGELVFTNPRVSPSSLDALGAATDVLRAQQALKPPPVDPSPILDRLNAQQALARPPGPSLQSSIETLTALLALQPRPPPPVPVTAKTPFTSTITFATPGDLSVAYVTQTGAYARYGPLVLFWINLQFTPTYTTASGNFVVGTLPIVPTDAVGTWAWPIRIFASPTWPASRTQIVALNNTAGTILIQGQGSGAGNQSFNTTNIVSGTQYFLTLSGGYF